MPMAFACRDEISDAAAPVSSSQLPENDLPLCFVMIGGGAEACAGRVVAEATVGSGPMNGLGHSVGPSLPRGSVRVKRANDTALRRTCRFVLGIPGSRCAFPGSNGVRGL